MNEAPTQGEHLKAIALPSGAYLSWSDYEWLLQNPGGVVVKPHTCHWCKRGFASPTVALDHEETCYFNPGAKT